MNIKKKETVTVLSQKSIGKDIYSLWIETEAALSAVPGQFVSVYCEDGSRLLPRPISICEIDKARKALRLVYRIAGAGTKEFAGLKADDTVKIIGPLGNGFPLKKGKAMLFGGGIGVPPMTELAKALEGEVQIVAGYQDEVFLEEELEKYGQLYIATESGSKGTKGNVLDAAVEHQLDADIIYACGPTPMLRAIKKYAAEKNIECWLSLEERMACGIGACLACVCKTKDIDEHTNVNNARICKDGPVFLAEEIDL